MTPNTTETDDVALTAPPPDTLWRETFTIRSYQVGPNGRATPQSLCRFLQEAASNHAEILQIGGEELAAQDMMWVLSRLRIRINETPKWREQITVETWPSQRTSGVRAHRDFRIYAGVVEEALGVDRQPIAEASSIWLLLTRKNRRPVRVPEFLAQYRLPGIDEDLLAASEIPPLEHTDSQKEFSVCATHLDFNNHVNNVCYLEWALNTLPLETFEKYRLREILFNFLAEGQIGDSIIARSQKVTDSPLAFRHTLDSASESRRLCAIETSWSD